MSNGDKKPIHPIFHLVAESINKESAQRRGDDVTQQPIWWHHHGYKLMVTNCDIPNRCVVFATNTTSIRFTQRAMTVDEGWFVDWMIRYGQQDQMNGRIVLLTRDLLIAFDLEVPKEAEADSVLTRRFDADVARQGRYIRTGPFLNIPGPGTGCDGDPNMSIYLEKSIRVAMDKLLQKEKT